MQLEDAASTTLTNATEFTPDKGTNVATVHVRPLTWTYEVKESSELKAEAKLHADFKTSFGGELPLKVVLLKTQEEIGAGAAVGVAAGQSTEKKFSS